MQEVQVLAPAVAVHGDHRFLQVQLEQGAPRGQLLADPAQHVLDLGVHAGQCGGTPPPAGIAPPAVDAVTSRACVLADRHGRTVIVHSGHLRSDGGLKGSTQHLVQSF
ncbi:hypothetical protein GCM10027586_01500 [Kineococcus gypseus]